MSHRTQHGYLLIADISGYTSYVAGTELEHSQQILGELLETIIGQLTPAMTLSKLEGDAVFCYAPEGTIAQGETLLELAEMTYVAFRDRVENVRRQTTCQCNACRAIPSLDLKFMAHHGDFIVQSIAGISELIGSDVNLLHRLLKNHVGEETGWRGYALFTEACLGHLSARPEGMRASAESYEHLGTVQTFSMDLRARYQEIIAQRRVIVAASEAMITVVREFDAPPPVIWEWLLNPVHRNVWNAGNTWTIAARPGGRIGPGASNHCAHGKSLSTETILDWRPFDYVTVENGEGSMVMRQTTAFEPIDAGRRTRVTEHSTTSMLPLPRAIRKPIFRFMMFRLFHYERMWDQAMVAFNERLRRNKLTEIGTPA